MNRHRGHGAGRDETAGNGETSGCAEFGPLLEEFHHQALEPEQVRLVAEHATGCAACRAALESLAATDRLIAEAPMPAPGPELRERLAARIAVARAHRPAETAASMPMKPITRETVVHDIRDTYDPNDSEWTRTRTPATGTRRGIQRVRVWLGTVAAVLVVALLAGMLLMKTHSTPGQVNTGHGSGPSSSQATCAPGDIKANLPAHSYLSDLAMVSPRDGWAVGSVLDEYGGPANTLIMHYQNCAWTPVTISYPQAMLMSVSMDSATDGWAVGGDSSGKPLALHFTGGTWQQVTLFPGESGLSGVYQSAHMRSADEGWIVLRHPKNQQGMLSESLLHLMNGSWSSVSAPFAMVNDVLPIGPDEAWVAGYVSDGQKSPVLYHYQAGKWTAVALPHGVAVDRLRMVSPNDIWASGHIGAPNNADSNQTAAVLRYDGSGWRQVRIAASGQPQFVQAFDANTSWAFTLAGSFNPIDVISGVQYQHDGAWRTISWPFNDISLGFTSLGMNPIQRAATNEYWTIGWREVTQPNASGNGNPIYPTDVLLYFANGAWHEYGK